MTLCPTETKAAGGLGSIAEQTVDHKVDVVLGGGRGRFNAAGGPIAGGPDNGKTVEESAARQGYTEVNDAAGLDAITPKNVPVLGLFTGQSGAVRSPRAATASHPTSARRPTGRPTSRASPP
jgi:alkaline phosphatase